MIVNSILQVISNHIRLLQHSVLTEQSAFLDSKERWSGDEKAGHYGVRERFAQSSANPIHRATSFVISYISLWESFPMICPIFSRGTVMILSI
jgi:hypothetical protein